MLIEKTRDELTREYWDKRNASTIHRRFWYQHPVALRYYRDLIVATAAPLSEKPIHSYLRQLGRPAGFACGLSIGCGAGFKEMALIRAGLVEHFDLFDLSHATVAQGEAKARDFDIEDRVCFSTTDVFAEQTDHIHERYDLVHWDNALHHMYDTPGAIAFSKAALKPGGLLIIDDYVGPSYFGFDDETFDLADRIRGLLPDRYLLNRGPDRDRVPSYPRTPRIPKHAFLRTDPSEMADSGRILPAVRDMLPGADVRLTGGIVYFLALRPLFGNFDPDDALDTQLLQSLLGLDQSLTQLYPNTNCHGFIAWTKPL